MSGLFVGVNHAIWTLQTGEGNYKFFVVRHHPDKPEEDGKSPWRWFLFFCDKLTGQHTHVRGVSDADLIWAPSLHDARSVLASLASFLSAWNEAITYGDADSENRNLFPEEAQAVLGAVEDFALAMDDA